VIEYAYLFFLLFFFVLGLVHGFEETEVEGRKTRAVPVFPVLLLFIPLALMLGFTVPGLGGVIATALEPTATTIRIQQERNTTAVVITSKPPSSTVLEPLLSWVYWAIVLAAAFFPLGGYYAGYNLAMWLDERETLPLLIRFPVFKVIELPAPEERIVVEARPKRRRVRDAYIILGGERWG
jgi:Kef-type K+ transport system membrane component KefB